MGVDWHVGCPASLGGWLMVGERLRVILALTDAFEGAAVMDGLLADGFEPVWRSTVQDVRHEMHEPFDLLIVDASLAANASLHSNGRSRDPLSPVILIGDEGSQPVDATGRSMYLSRPVDRAKLACFVAMALQQDRPVRRSTRKRVNRVRAIVDAVPAYIVDVSAEGLRMEVPRDRRSPLPPLFSVRLPGANLSLTVQRRWTQPLSKGVPTTYCGGALCENRASVEHAWRLFVDSVPIVGEA